MCVKERRSAIDSVLSFLFLSEKAIYYYNGTNNLDIIRNKINLNHILLRKHQLIQFITFFISFFLCVSLVYNQFTGICRDLILIQISWLKWYSPTSMDNGRVELCWLSLVGWWRFNLPKKKLSYSAGRFFSPYYMQWLASIVLI